MHNAESAKLGLGLLLASSITLGGCATLPTNGPTAHQVRLGAERSTGPYKFNIVPLDASTVEALRSEDHALAAQIPTLSQLAVEHPVDRVGPGDILSVALFEVGVSLFASRQSAEGFDPSAHPQDFPDLTVSTDGTIDLPYAGTLTVSGKTTHEIAEIIDRALASKSQNPNAIVTIKKNISNTAVISGDASKPGRYPLDVSRPRLLDAIADSGGSKNTAEDTVVRFSRGGNVVDERLGFIRAGSPDDLVLVPGDRIELIRRPRSYTVFGATAKASQVSFETGAVSLAEAVARAGGPSDNSADASAVYLFRFDGVPDSPNIGKPTVYRVNMLDPVSYLLAQRFQIRDKDVLYFANAAANQPSKLVAVINQLFSPFVAARVLTQ